MPKPKITGRHWSQRREAFRNVYNKGLTDYLRYMAWRRGDWTDLVSALGVPDSAAAPVNMVALTFKAFQSNMFFNSPTYTVAHGPGKDAKIELAKVETELLNEAIEQNNYYTHGRRCLLDGFLGPFYCIKVGYSADIVADRTLLDTERVRAKGENDLILQGKRPKRGAKDLDTIHIEIHELQLTNIEDSTERNIPIEDKEYLKAHIEAHYAAREAGFEPTNESVRSERVFIQRVKPTCVFFDPFAEDFDSLGWVSEAILRPLDDVKEDVRYNASWRAELKATPLAQIHKILKYPLHYKEIQNSSDSMVLLWQNVDYRHREVSTYAEGNEDTPGRVAPYTLSRIIPSGPYIFGVFEEDGDLNIGIPNPKFWEEHQRVLTTLVTVQVLIAKASVGGMGIKQGKVSDAEIQEYKQCIINRILQFKNLDDNESLADAMVSLPTPTISQETFAVTGLAMQLIERLSGMGQTRLGGGERSKTATASSLIDEAVDAFMRVSATVWDKTNIRVGKYITRLQRKLYMQQTVRAIVGDRALEVWPEDGFTDGYVLDDRGVDIVVGSMRREVTDVQLKLSMDLYGVVSQDPIVPAPAKMKLLNHIMTLAHMPIDLVEEIKTMEEAAAKGGAAPTNGMPSPQSMLQGVQNVGGGRLPGRS